MINNAERCKIYCLRERGSVDSNCESHMGGIKRGNLCLSTNKGHAINFKLLKSENYFDSKK